MSLIFVDCEGHGPAPTMNDAEKFEFGAVEFGTRQTFHGHGSSDKTIISFEEWLRKFEGQPVFVSDNPAYDWQFLNYLFHYYLGRNPFGHSARRIGDFYAGLRGDWRKTQEWKRLRTVSHNHNPVHDAEGNAGAFERILNGER